MRTDVTYGQLDQGLRRRGFSCRPATLEAKARVYEHPPTGAVVVLPAFPEAEKVLDYHLATVQTTLDGFGIAAPLDFAADLQKAS